MIIEQLSYVMVYIAEAFIAWLYYEYLFARKKSSCVTLALFIIFYIVLFLIFQLGITIINTFCFFLFNFLLSLFLYFCAPRTAILHSAFLSFIMTISEILIGLIIAVFVGDFAAYTYSIAVMIPMAIISKLLYLLLALISARIFAPHKSEQDEPQLMVLFCSLPVLSAFFSVIVAYLSLHNDWPVSSEFIIVISIFGLLFINLVFFVLYNYQQQTNAEFLSLQLSMQKEESDAAYYKALHEQAESQKVLIHDIKNHLQIIDGLAKDQDTKRISEYIETLDATLFLPKGAKLSNDPILDLLLIQYAEKCKKAQIDFICDIRDHCSAFLDAPSKTTIFGNLLANAFEAADKSIERIVEITVTYIQEQEIIVISVINSCDNAPVLGKNGRYISQKNNPGIHGVGLKGIERVVRKYHGLETMYFDEISQKFHHIIQLPAIRLT